jgi:hypothetical protein
MPERPAHVRALAANLELLSHGGTTAWGASGAGIPDSRPPSGDSRPPHLQFLADWDRRGDRVLAHWTGVLNSWKGCGKVRPVGVSEDEWILKDGEGFSAVDVARRFRCTPTRVRRLRRAAGRHEETGEKGETIVDQAKRLRAQRVPVREIAARVGKHPTQVQRWTKAA